MAHLRIFRRVFWNALYIAIIFFLLVGKTARISSDNSVSCLNMKESISKSVTRKLQIATYLKQRLRAFVTI